MECVGCQFDNREGAKFCKNCVTRLEFLCPSCGHSCDTDSSFCDECGGTLKRTQEPSLPKDLSFDEKLSQIQRFLPKGLTDKVLSQRGKIEGERRQVTIMFVDMKGFTPLTEALGPEETFALMDQVYEIMIHKIHEYEGTVNELRGDGILALFGAPVALEDGPQRAILALLSMHREMVKFSEKLRAEKDTPSILLRIGINTGPVVLGTLGNDLRVQFTAVGETINLAARMEQMAEPGTTYVTEDTFKLTEGFFRFEALGEKEVKGKAKRVRVYRVIAPTTIRTRFDVSAERGLTPLVARERELELLLDGYERAKAGRGQAFSVVGEAGVGKSRLLYEFRKAVANENATFLEGKCLSYGKGIPYHPIIDILKANFDVQEGDVDSEIREKVKRDLEMLEADEAFTLPYLLELLSVKDSGMDKIQMSPEGKKDKIIEAIKEISLKGSEMRPLIIAMEDLHWMDKNSEDVSKYLLESIPGARVLLIFTFRPEFVQTWGGKSFHNRVTLNRLSNRESLSMVSHFLGTENIDTDLEDLILEKTEGVPFFIEEFVKSLRELKLINRQGDRYHLALDFQDLTIPSTIQDVIMARVDGLPEGAKELLQAGSVIEREFSYDLIKEVIGLPEQELLSCLAGLKESELLYERGIYPECAYIFKHALTREVVYDSVLTSRRKRLHNDIANAIEALRKDNIDVHYGVLAEHYITGENWEKAAKYSRLAGKSAAKTASMHDAIAHGKKTIASLERLPQTDDVQLRLIDARTLLGLCYTHLTQHVEAKKAIDPVMDLAIRLDYRRRLCQLHSITGNFYALTQEDFTNAFKELTEAQRLSQETGDMVSLFHSNFWLGIALSFDCRFERAISCMERAVQTNVEANLVWGIAASKGAMSYFGYYLQGEIDSSYHASSEAIQLAERSADVFSKSGGYVAHGISCYGKGLTEDAKGALLKGQNLCDRIDWLFWRYAAAHFRGEISFDEGDYEQAMIHFRQAAQFLERAGFMPAMKNASRIAVARAESIVGDKSVDLESLYRIVDENKVRLFEGWTRRYLGQILLNIDNQHTSEAQHWIEQAIETDQRNDMTFHLGRDHALYAELFKRKGDTVKAKDQLGKAMDIYKECGADGWVTKAEKEMARLD